LELERHRAEWASAAKFQFLATMSHELRTRLAGVMGMAELIQAGELSNEQAGRVGRICRSASPLLNFLMMFWIFQK